MQGSRSLRSDDLTTSCRPFWRRAPRRSSSSSSRPMALRKWLACACSWPHPPPPSCPQYAQPATDFQLIDSPFQLGSLLSASFLSAAMWLPMCSKASCRCIKCIAFGQVECLLSVQACNDKTCGLVPGPLSGHMVAAAMLCQPPTRSFSSWVVVSGITLAVYARAVSWLLHVLF